MNANKFFDEIDLFVLMELEYNEVLDSDEPICLHRIGMHWISI